MTNDKLPPQDEAGDDEILDSTEADQSQDIDDQTDAHIAAELNADDPSGEDLVLETEDDADYVVVDDEAEELTDADDTLDETPDKGDPEDVVIDDEDQLADAEQVAATAKSSRPAKRKVTTAPIKKNRPTAKQEDTLRARGEVRKKRTTPAGFAAQAAAELKKVIWPSGDQLREYFLVVLFFVLIVVGIVSLLDLGFGRLLLWALA